MAGLDYDHPFGDSITELFFEGRSHIGGGLARSDNINIAIIGQSVSIPIDVNGSAHQSYVLRYGFGRVRGLHTGTENRSGILPQSLNRPHDAWKIGERGIGGLAKPPQTWQSEI